MKKKPYYTLISGKIQKAFWILKIHTKNSEKLIGEEFAADRLGLAERWNLSVD